MNARSLLTVLAAAAATTAVLLAWLAPRGVTADDPSSSIRPRLAVPTLSVDGCQVRLQTDRDAYAPGDRPILRLSARNTSSRPAQIHVSLAVTATSPSSPLSRMVALPRTLWQGQWAVDVPPGATREIALPTDAALPAGEEVAVLMASGDQSMLAGQLAIAGTRP